MDEEDVVRIIPYIATEQQIYVESKKVKQTGGYNKKKQTHRYREETSS